jgi:hypothetical protein
MQPNTISATLTSRKPRSNRQMYDYKSVAYGIYQESMLVCVSAETFARVNARGRRHDACAPRVRLAFRARPQSPEILIAP